MPRSTRTCIFVLAALCCGPLAAQRAEPLPQELEEVGITQNLERQIDLDLPFVDEQGEIVSLSAYFSAERPVLLSLVYYECPMLCTLVLDGMVRVLEQMEWIPGKQFEIVTVSFDPNDTAELAREKKNNYLRSYGRPQAAAGWHFLTGSPDSIERLTREVGFRYRYLEENGEFAHPAALIILTPDGRISRYLYGVHHDPQTLRLSLVEAAAGGIGSPVDQFLLYCYRYDPDKGTYAPVAMKLMRVGGGLTVLVIGSLLALLYLREARNKRLT